MLNCQMISMKLQYYHNHKSTRCVEREKNTHVVTNDLLVDKKDPKPSCSKTRLMFKSKAICKMMGTASSNTLQTSEERDEESVAVIAIA